MSREPLPDAFLKAILIFLHEEKQTKSAIDQEKKRLCKELGIEEIPSNIRLLTSLDEEDANFAKPFLLTKPMRSGSGVSVVAVMTKPSRCPHGRCTYCPGGLGSSFGDVPQSYTGNEPASMRGARAGYDSYVQVFNRLEQYLAAGHDPQKIEIIVMGGTFPNEPVEYQTEFISDIFQALNDFSKRFFDEEGILKLDEFKTFFLLPGDVKDVARVKKIQERIREVKDEREGISLAELQEENETARIRCIGLTSETRPSHGRLAEGNRLLEQGCTRVELGVQTTFDDVLTAVHRDHSVQDSIDSIGELRDLGFKLNFHLMLGLPGMTRKKDLEAAKRLFEDPGFKPDMLKIYPCMVMPGTKLYSDYKAGNFTPLSTEDAAEIIVEIKKMVPSWCRIMRVQRDIPTNVTEAGVDRTNLRQIVMEKCAEEGVQCQCIRCREIGERSIKKAVLNVVGYPANGGEEFFISIDDPSQNALIGFCRLRLPGRQLRAEFDIRTAIIRELHVYGKATNIGVVGLLENAQHRGFGNQLMQVAERIAQEHGKKKLLVISGVGVREYYRKLGYAREGPYMAKEL